MYISKNYHAEQLDAVKKTIDHILNRVPADIDVNYANNTYEKCVDIDKKIEQDLIKYSPETLDLFRKNVDQRDDYHYCHRWTLSTSGRYYSKITIEAAIKLDYDRMDDSGDGIELRMYGSKETYRDFQRRESDFDFPEIEGYMLNYIHDIREKTDLAEQKLREAAIPVQNKRVKRITVGE